MVYKGLLCERLLDTVPNLKIKMYAMLMLETSSTENHAFHTGGYIYIYIFMVPVEMVFPYSCRECSSWLEGSFDCVFRGIVFTHGVRMGGRVGGGKKFVGAVSQKP